MAQILVVTNLANIVSIEVKTCDFDILCDTKKTRLIAIDVM